MNESMMIALQISVIGMGLVFASIILLWGVMALLVRLAADSSAPAGRAGQAEAGRGQDAAQYAALAQERKRRAALAAVAVALAQDNQNQEPHEFPLPPTAMVSAWQSVMRSNNLNKRGPTR